MANNNSFKSINKFEGEFDFLSNFSPAEVTLGGEIYPTVEHAFQAAKTLDYDERLKIQKALTPNKAKRIGQKVALRPDWDNIKRGVMIGILVQKFAPHTENGQKLIATGNAELIEDNWWGDTYWGVCKGEGENHLGKLLMEIRKKLQSKPIKQINDQIQIQQEIVTS